MNPKNLVKISNIIGRISILLLVYWVFVFMTTEVFGLKVVLYFSDYQRYGKIGS